MDDLITKSDLPVREAAERVLNRCFYIFYKHMNFRNQAGVCLIKNCKKAQSMLVICLFQSFRKMSPISYVKGIRLY